VPRFRARGLDFEHGLHRGEAREAANLSRVARLAKTRRGLCTARGGGGATPVSSTRRLEARGLQQEARVASSPPCVTPGRLHDGGAATAAARARVSPSSAQEKAAARARAGDPRGCGGGLNRPGASLGVRATPRGACAGAARTRTRVRLGFGGCGCGRGGGGLAAVVGRLVGYYWADCAGLQRGKRAEANTWRGADGLS
jgi:hypothetical protein